MSRLDKHPRKEKWCISISVMLQEKKKDRTLISVVIYGRQTVSKVQLDRGLYFKSLYYKM